MGKDHPIELFMPPNMLKAKVGCSIASIDVAAIARAEMAMDALKAEFSDWFTEDVKRLLDCHERFAAHKDAKTRNALYRASHDLKGQAATFGFPLVGRIASSLCKLFEGPESPVAIPLVLIDAHVSAIRVIFRDKIDNASDRAALELAEQLEARVLETMGSAA